MNRLRRSLFVAGAAITALVALEFLSGIGLPRTPGMPLIEPAPGEKYRFRLRPGLDTPFSGFSAPARTVRLLTDSRGFRVSPSDVDAGDPFEMYIFGDEFVVGEGLEASETFPARFEKIYRDRYKEQYRVHNAGVPGYNLRLSLERLLVELRTGKPFDWVLVIRDDDLGPAISPLEQFAWSAPVGLRLLERAGKMASRFAGAKAAAHETRDSLAPIIAELKQAVRKAPMLRPCVISVVTDSELHIEIASDLVRAGRCQRHDAVKWMGDDAGHLFDKAIGSLTAEGSGEFALSMLTGLSASFQYRPGHGPSDPRAPADGTPVDNQAQ